MSVGRSCAPSRSNAAKATATDGLGAVPPNSERRSWRLHRELVRHLKRSTLTQWQPTIERNLQRLRTGVAGEPHLRNLDRWKSLLDHRDVPGLHRFLTGLSRDCIEMREVAAMGGLLTDNERIRVLRTAH